jgi:hypothetical protein
MKEFLAYEGDAHIAFVRKTPEISVPRFDKVSCKTICMKEPSTLGKQLVSFITCGCESSAPFFVTYKAGCEPTPYW